MQLSEFLVLATQDSRGMMNDLGDSDRTLPTHKVALSLSLHLNNSIMEPIIFCIISCRCTLLAVRYIITPYTQSSTVKLGRCVGEY
jgi:hypothetical protein